MVADTGPIHGPGRRKRRATHSCWLRLGAVPAEAAWRPCLPAPRGRDGGAATAGGAAPAQLQRAAAAATTARPLAGATLDGPTQRLHFGSRGRSGRQ